MFVGYPLHSLTAVCRYYFWQGVDSREDIDLVYYGFHNPKILILPEATRANRWITYGANKLRKRITIFHNIKEIRKIIREESPDALMFAERFLENSSWCKLNMNIPIILQIDDQHVINDHNLRDYSKRNNVVLALSRHNFPIEYFKSMVNFDVKPFPWSIDTTIFKDYGFPMIYDVMASGVISKAYPLRYKIMDFINSAKDIRVHRMRYPIISMFGNCGGLNTMERYAKLLSVSRELVFGASIWLQSLQKYFEGMASNCIVLSQKPHDADFLHFVSGKNFVAVNENNLEDEIRYYLDNESERKKVVRNGNSTIRKYHTLDKRIDQFVSYIKEVI